MGSFEKIIFIVTTLLFLSCNCNGYEVSLQIKNDTFQASGWKVSKSHSWGYFETTEDIHDTYVPVHAALLPQGSGVWVMRYKDMIKTPNVFETKENSISSIRYSAKANLFNAISIKAIVIGEAELNLAVDNFNIPLSSKDCTVTETSGDTKRYKWTTYTVKTNLINHVELIPVINHPDSFVVVDKITISYPSSPNENDLHEVNYTLSCET